MTGVRTRRCKPFVPPTIEERIARAIDNERRKQACFYHIDHRPARMGDLVVLNYQGTIEGKKFPGSKAIHHRMILKEQSKSDPNRGLPGLAEQVAGHAVGDTFVANITFPPDYRNPQLAGHTAVYEVTLLFMGWEEVPDFDDDFARDFSEYETAGEWLEAMRAWMKGEA